MYNVGENSYKPEKYGDSIRIARTVTQSTSTYKIMDDKGRVVVEKKQKEDMAEWALENGEEPYRGGVFVGRSLDFGSLEADFSRGIRISCFSRDKESQQREGAT